MDARLPSLLRLLRAIPGNLCLHCRPKDCGRDKLGVRSVVRGRVPTNDSPRVGARVGGCGTTVSQLLGYTTRKWMRGTFGSV